MRIKILVLAFMYVVISVFLVCLRAHAGEVWVTTPNISSKLDLENLALGQKDQVKSLGITSFYDHELSHPVSAAQLKHFLTEEAKAQKSELNGDLISSYDQYSHLLKELLQVPNVSGVEIITLSVLIHRAQIASLLNRNDAERLWSDARGWQGRSEELQRDEFSPGLIQKFNEVHAKKPIQLVIELEGANDESLFIDGKPIEKNSISVAAGTHQVCALAAGTFWSCSVIETHENETEKNLKLSLKTPVHGSCDLPQYDGPELPDGVRFLVAFERDCKRVYYKKEWFTIDGKKLEALTQNEDMHFQHEIPHLDESLPEQKSFLEKLVHSPWFWVAAGAVTATSVYLLTPPTITPSHGER